MLTPASLREIDEILTRYPVKRAALLPMCHVIQKERGFISAEAEEWIAARLDLAPVKVHEAITFYTMLYLAPVGRHHLQVCRTLSCALRGCERLLSHLKTSLGLLPGESTADGLFSLQEVECLGACGNAPVVQVNDAYHMDLSVEGLDTLLLKLRSGSDPATPKA